MHKKQMVVMGGGGHTRSLLGLLIAAGEDIRGIVTADEALLGTTIMGIPVLGRDGDVVLDPRDVTLINGIGNHATRNGAGMTVRRMVYQRYRDAGFDFLPLVDGHAVVQPHAMIAAGATIMAGAVIQPGAQIGENSIVNTRAAIDHDVTVHAHCHIAPGAVLCGHVTVGEATHIGAGAIILQGVTVGRDAVIGAGAVIKRDVAMGVVVGA